MTRKVFGFLVAFVIAGGLVAAAGQPQHTPDVAGTWNISIESPHGKMVWNLSLKTNGKAVTGTIGNDQMGSFELKGEIVDGKLAFKFQAASSFEFNGKLKDANTLVGTITGEGNDMACTAARVK